MIDKEELLRKCVIVIDDKLKNIQRALDDYKSDLLSESKSSAGDKHETGRAMLQLEMEKLGNQYQTILVQKELLSKINIAVKSFSVRIGSLVLLNNIYYFIASSIGQIEVEGKIVMVVSVNSPIGQLLLGKENGTPIVFNGNEVNIQNVW